MNPRSPFYITTESLCIRTGCWNTTKCTVWDKTGGVPIEIGQYSYNYHSHAEAIFYPFKQGDQWYALYSTHYETIALMTLPNCEEVKLTEESRKNLHGFCPVESWVPSYKGYIHRWDNDGKTHEGYIYLGESELVDPSDEGEDALPIQYHTFAFCAGCVWGDDSSWSVNMLDLSKIKEGVLKYVPHKEYKWSYLELPCNVPLNKAIHIDVFDDEPNKPRLWWAVPKVLDYKDGQLVDIR